MLSAIGSVLITIISFSVMVGLPVVIGAILSPTLRKEGRESLRGGWDRIVNWGQTQRSKATGFLQQRQEKAEAKKVERQKKTVNQEAFTALAVAFSSGNEAAFQKVRNQYADDIAVQEFANRLINEKAKTTAVTAAAKADGSSGPPALPGDTDDDVRVEESESPGPPSQVA